MKGVPRQRKGRGPFQSPTEKVLPQSYTNQKTAAQPTLKKRDLLETYFTARDITTPRQSLGKKEGG